MERDFFTRARSDRESDNNLKLKDGRFRLDGRNNSLLGGW